MPSRDLHRRLDRVAKKRDGNFPRLTDALGAELVDQWNELVFLDTRGKARIDGELVPWNQAAYVYLPSRDGDGDGMIYSTNPAQIWSAGLSSEDYDNPLYADK